MFDVSKCDSNQEEEKKRTKWNQIICNTQYGISDDRKRKRNITWAGFFSSSSGVPCAPSSFPYSKQKCGGNSGKRLNETFNETKQGDKNPKVYQQHREFMIILFYLSHSSHSVAYFWMAFSSFFLNTSFLPPEFVHFIRLSNWISTIHSKPNFTKCFENSNSV